jgi:hypothetical protein
MRGITRLLRPFTDQIEALGYVWFIIDPSVSHILGPFLFCLKHDTKFSAAFQVCTAIITDLYKDPGGILDLQYRTVEQSPIYHTDTPLAIGLRSGEVIQMTFTIRMSLSEN